LATRETDEPVKILASWVLFHGAKVARH
jgi:hypothetical protein